MITIPIETKVRELDEKALLAFHLAADGHEVVIGPERSVDDHAERSGTDLHFVNGCAWSPQRARLYPALARQGVRLLLLDTEGDLHVESPRLYARFHPDLVPFVHRYFAWGREPARLATEVLGMPSEKVIVTGTPRFDLLRPPYDALHHPERDRIRARLGRFILIDTNFTVANPFAANTVRWLVPDERRIVHQRAMLEHLREAVPRLAGLDRDVKVVIRPHPGERLATYEEMFRGDNRIRVIFEGSVQPWLQAATVLIHNSCTTGVEAAMMGTPVIAYTPTGYVQEDFTIANEVSEPAPSTDALLIAVRRHLAGEERREDCVNDRLAAVYANAERPAVDSIRQAIASIALDPAPDRRLRTTARGSARTALLRLLGQRALDLARDIRNIGRREQLAYARHKMSGISLDEMRARLARLAAIEPRLGDVECVSVPEHEHTFRVRRRRA